MKNYTSSDYAANKSAKGIVYPFVNQTVEITVEDYLRENPDKTPADFAALKALSDSDYYETERSDYRQTWKNTPLDSLFEEEAAILSVPSVEDDFIEGQEHEAEYVKRKSVARLAMDKLTETPRRRYLMYHVGGLSLRQIADKESVQHSKIQKSIVAAEKKIKKFLHRAKNGGTKRAFFHAL
jgi:DNA-directed RNA polymerase specialized sigma24 family protein